MTNNHQSNQIVEEEMETFLHTSAGPTHDEQNTVETPGWNTLAEHLVESLAEFVLYLMMPVEGQIRPVIVVLTPEGEFYIHPVWDETFVKWLS